jgi:16S rRNA (uracil1498-N3)-methyltransferase
MRLPRLGAQTSKPEDFMPHFYVEPENIAGNVFKIEREQAHYVSTVRRFSAGDEIMIFDGLGKSYKGEIINADKNFISGKILSSSYKTPRFEINLCTAVPKGERFEWLIEKAAETGVSKIIPLISKRSAQTKLAENKLSRYEKISISASSQCGRNDIMKILNPQDFKTLCKTAAADESFVNLLLWESSPLNEDLPSLLKNGNAAKANIFIGPEGGFAEDEVAFAGELGIKTATLGENILRIETAAIAAVILTTAQLCKNTI